MKNKGVLIAVIIIIFILIGLFIYFGIDWLFSKQYNEKGISHFLVITIDKNQSKKYIGKLDGYNIYIEHLNIKETNFRNVNAENVSIKEAISKKLVSINEWKKYAWSIKKNGDFEILKYDNYEIACDNENCIIRPYS